MAHLIFGIPATINSANYVYFLALEKCNKLNNVKATCAFVGKRIYFDDLICRGAYQFAPWSRL